MGAVRAGGFTGWVDDAGTRGRPVVFVHGSGLSGASWQRVIAAFDGERRRIVVDLLGYGRSDPTPRGGAVTAEDDLALLDAVTRDLGPCDVVAHSYGGVLALRLARRAPERFSRLVLIEPVLFASLRAEGSAAPGVAEELAKLYDDPLFLDDTFGGTEPWMERFFDYWWGAGAWAALSPTHRRASMRSAWKVFREVKSISGGGSGGERFADWRDLGHAPTLVVGTRTTACARAIVARLEAELPGAQRTEIEGAAHMSPLTHPDALGAILRAHLGAVD